MFFALLFLGPLFQRCENDSCPDDDRSVVESIEFLNTNTQYAWVQQEVGKEGKHQRCPRGPKTN